MWITNHSHGADSFLSHGPCSQARPAQPAGPGTGHHRGQPAGQLLSCAADSARTQHLLPLLLAQRAPCPGGGRHSLLGSFWVEGPMGGLGLSARPASSQDRQGGAAHPRSSQGRKPRRSHQGHPWLCGSNRAGEGCRRRLSTKVAESPVPSVLTGPQVTPGGWSARAALGPSAGRLPDVTPPPPPLPTCCCRRGDALLSPLQQQEPGAAQLHCQPHTCSTQNCPPSRPWLLPGAGDLSPQRRGTTLNTYATLHMDPPPVTACNKLLLQPLELLVPW